jgi:death-on-curing protein
VTPAEPEWLRKELVLAIHEAMIRLHGGLAGVRDPGLLESALARPKNLLAHEAPDLFVLAATYAEGIARNHPFHDGNKRTAFVSAVTFLERNGCRFRAPEHEVVVQVLALVERRSTRDAFAAWLRTSSGKPKPRKPRRGKRA